MSTRIKLRRDINSDWTANNPILGQGELGLVTDAISDSVKIKIGDGTTAWNSLSYFSPGGSTSWGAITGTLSNQTDLQSELNLKATDSAVVHLSGTETITGSKTFSLDIISANTKGLTWASGSLLKDNSGSIALTANQDITLTSDNSSDITLESAGSVNVNAGGGGNIGLNSATSVSVSLSLGYATASTLVGLDGSKNVVSLSTATYPSLTELSYVKGVSSAIQGQIDGKQPLDSDLTSWAGVTRASGFDTFVATPSSANLRSLLTDELGTGAAIFDGATPSTGLVLTNCTGLPVSSGISGLGTNVATALAVNVGSSGAFVTNGGALGTPSSGTLTNCTGLPTSGITGYQGYTLEAETAQFNPADATTHYFGVLVTTVNTTDGNTAILIPKAGTLKRVDIVITNQGTLGSNETSTISFRLNSTTDTTISSAVVTNAARGAFTATGLSVAVAANDTFEIKWVSPSWATNPTSIRLKAILYIE